MSIIARMRKQICVYWALASSDSAGEDFDDAGQPQYADPEELSCRWDYVVEEYVDAKGTRRTSRSKVYVGEDLDVGGALMLGEKTDVVEEENVLENDGAYEIKRFDKTPNFKATEFLKVAYL